MVLKGGGGECCERGGSRLIDVQTVHRYPTSIGMHLHRFYGTREIFKKIIDVCKNNVLNVWQRDNTYINIIALIHMKKVEFEKLHLLSRVYLCICIRVM